ncbi:aspartyl-phosphate phosphatase Spo0E family protein [Bacillus sp. FJAT-45350]|uniref:aspartyl-phosphate phosphatase Spo0E family protein n=1 Tax=Bacillus sp. FJAT-45350 TaxID=2011014 RepID=UPI000BB78DF5|nr:aspartyl-phosphate phosphatase Spo0E family protein [Bacillus sp. FJAT-45350]
MDKRALIIELEYKIDTLRIRMIKLAQSKGFNHPDTIECSQELDVFLNKYQRLKSN